MSLIIKHQKKDNKELIIFVHGLGGDINTFQNDNKKYFHEYFEDCILEKADIGYFEYPTTFFSSKALSTLSNMPVIGKYIPSTFNTNIDDLTSLLKTEYDNYKGDYKKIHFISHSLGGIIVKNLLISRNIDISQKTFYITLSTPHSGSAFAETFNIFGNPHLKEIELESNYLTKLNENFKYHKNNFHRKYYVAINDTIVKQINAYQPDDEECKAEVNGNHIMIAKPDEQHKSQTLVKNINKTIKEFLHINNAIKEKIINNNQINNIFFDSFRAECNDYYLIRDTDNEVLDILKSKSLWLHGDSEIGKTNIIQYYCFKSKRDFSHSTYFTSIETSVEEYLKIIYEELLDRGFHKVLASENQHINQKLKVLLCSLSEQYNTVTLHLDELSDLEEKNTQKFLLAFVDIFSNYINVCELNNINIIITTRFNPEKYLLNIADIGHKNKINKLFKFKQLNTWTEAELQMLYNLINKNIDLGKSYSYEYFKHCSNPRELKDSMKAIYIGGQNV